MSRLKLGLINHLRARMVYSNNQLTRRELLLRPPASLPLVESNLYRLCALGRQRRERPDLVLLPLLYQQTYSAYPSRTETTDPSGSHARQKDGAALRQLQAAGQFQTEGKM